jgi:hypothetical protein
MPRVDSDEFNAMLHETVEQRLCREAQDIVDAIMGMPEPRRVEMIAWCRVLVANGRLKQKTQTN